LRCVERSRKSITG